MATSPDPWTSILRSIEKRRSYDARFFKPVCLIAAMDSVLAGEMTPPVVEPNTVIERFRGYVAEVYPERADLGWRPFWHLSNDGVWEITKEGRLVDPANFGVARKPDSRGQLMRRMDQVTIPSGLLPQWRSRQALALLREALLQMLDRDDATCQSMAAVLRGFSPPSTEIPSSKAPETTARRSARQGFQSSSEVRMAVERHAMAVAMKTLEAEGWNVTDMSAFESFDLLCRRNDAKAYAEVKGTIGAGERVIVTRAEVEFARAHEGSMVLVVVSNMELSRNEEGRLIASNGLPAIHRNWVPQPSDLDPIAYTCRLRSAHQEAARRGRAGRGRKMA